MSLNHEHIRQLRLHFDGAATNGHKLPASALVQALERFQRVVHLIAMAEEGREVLQIARVTKEIERRFPLICSMPENGGFALPITIGGEADRLFDEYECEKIAKTTREVISAVNSGDARQLGGIVPDTFYRRSILQALENMQPEKHSCLIINIEDYYKKTLLNGSSALEKIKQILTPPISEISTADFGYVTGTLIEMKFHERRLVVKLLDSSKTLTATYADDFEPVLLNNARELIQVHGNIVSNDDGSPQSISDVDDILEIDETAIEISLLILNDTSLKLKKPLCFAVTFDRETSSYHATGPFDIFIFAATRTEIEEELYSELTILWNEYANADPNSLTTDAQMLQKELLGTFEEVPNAI
jgi:hypothetical protein